MLDEANIPFAPVRTPSDLFDDPQMNAHGRMLPIRMPKGNVAKLPTTPICFDDEAPGIAPPASRGGRAYRRSAARAGLFRRTNRRVARRRCGELRPGGRMRVAIIGGGVLGASTALHLAHAGADVVLVDAAHDGRATAAGAGIVCPWVSGADDGAVLSALRGGARYYPDLVALVGASWRA